MDPFIIPAGISALGGLMSAFGKKRPAQQIQMPRFSPGQQGAMSGFLGQAQQGLQDPYAGFDPIAQGARESFHSQTMPRIAEQFAGLGATRSGSYNAAMAGAGQGLERDLASQRAGFGLQNRSSLMNLAQLGLQPMFENIYRPEAPGMMQSLGSSLMGTGIGALGQAGFAKQQGKSRLSEMQAIAAAFGGR